MKKRILCLLMVVVLLGSYLSITAEASKTVSGYTDVPSTNWAAGYINQATQLGIINGIGNGLFGIGLNVTRAQFATMLVRLFGWISVSPAAPSFSDNQNKSAWYYSAIETAVVNGAVLTDSQYFRPDEYITREEMAVMLVLSLGYDTLASQVSGYGIPFTDVTHNIGYITIAYNFGIINGMTTNTFEPEKSATREQAAAMMIRLHDKYSSKIKWLHAFYAISSASQMNSIPDFNAVSFGWSRLEYSESGGVLLNTTSSGGNIYSFPSGYNSVMHLVQSTKVPANLNISMSASQTVEKSDGTISNACREILLNPGNRSKAVTQIISELNSNNFLSGVTIDFEEMKGTDLKDGLTAFLKELRTGLNGTGISIYVCVHPVTSDGQYYNAYDYKAIGEYSDKVILMAHDYQPTSMQPNMMAAGYTATPLTPIYEVYYALKAVTDPNTGVEEINKVALAVSFNTEQWQLQNNQVINSIPYHPDTASVNKRLMDSGTTINYSKQYENAFATFSGDNNTQNIVWYEDERSISAKVKLARMFGVNGISVWRLGLIPNYPDGVGSSINYNVLDCLMSEK